jgi:hypothetical protein
MFTWQIEDFRARIGTHAHQFLVATDGGDRLADHVLSTPWHFCRTRFFGMAENLVHPVSNPIDRINKAGAGAVQSLQLLKDLCKPENCCPRGGHDGCVFLGNQLVGMNWAVLEKVECHFSMKKRSFPPEQL